MSERIPAAAPRWVLTDIVGPMGWHLAIPFLGDGTRWRFPHQGRSDHYHYAVTFAACQQVEICPPTAFADPPSEAIEAQLLQDPIGTIAALIGRMPCPPSTAVLLLANTSEGPLEIRRGSVAAIEAMLDEMTVPDAAEDAA